MIMKIRMNEVAQEALLVNQPKKMFAIQKSIEHSSEDMHQQPYWLLMIRDLVEGAGYNYSRIAKKIGACPSTVQKLITHPGRRPRQCLFERLLVLYHQVFHGPYITQRAQEYLQTRQASVIEQLPKDWVKRLVAKSAG